MKHKSDRLLAVKILAALLSDKGSLSSQLTAQTRATPEANLPLIQELTYGVCRWHPRLAFFAGRLMDKPLRAKDLDVHCLILLGLYQLFFMRTPDHAAVNETVATTRLLKKPWASNLVNAVLRQALRERDALEAAARENPEARFAHPRWLIDAIRRDWPDQADTILENNNRQAPMVLRVNLARSDREQVLAALASRHIAAAAGTVAESAITLESPVDVDSLPGFAEGRLSVQDEASQLASAILAPPRGARVLDACAAPGGKTCALLEQAGGDLDLLALDNSDERLERVRENLERAGLQARIACADATDPAAWWDGEAFDAILLDAPCSATGVIRRHPDIKLLRQAAAVSRLASLQQQMLASLWPCLKPGGRLLYSTCSVLREENEKQISTFLESQPDAVVRTLSRPGALSCAVGMQFLPGMAGTDGFYYCLLEKQ